MFTQYDKDLTGTTDDVGAPIDGSQSDSVPNLAADLQQQSVPTLPSTTSPIPSRGYTPLTAEAMLDQYRALKEKRDSDLKTAQLADAAGNIAGTLNSYNSRPAALPTMPSQADAVTKRSEQDIGNLLQEYKMLRPTTTMMKNSLLKGVTGENGEPLVGNPNDITAPKYTIDGKLYQGNIVPEGQKEQFVTKDNNPVVKKGNKFFDLSGKEVQPSDIVRQSGQNIIVRNEGMNERQQNSLDVTQQTRDEKMLQSFAAKASASEGARNTIGRNQLVIDRGNAILALMSPDNMASINSMPYDQRITQLNSLINQQSEEVTQALNTMVSQGGGSESSREHLRLKTLQSSLADLQQKITGNPEPAQLGKLLESFRNTTNREIKTAQVNQDTVIAGLGAGYKKVLDRHPEERDMILGNVGSAAGTTRQNMMQGTTTPAQVIAGNPSTAQPAVQQTPAIQQNVDPKIAQFAQQHNLDYSKAEAILRNRGYGK